MRLPPHRALVNRAAGASRPSGFAPLRDTVSLAGGTRVRGRRHCVPAPLSLPLRRLPSLMPPLRFGVEGTAPTSRTPRALTVCSVFASRVAWLPSQLYRGRRGTSAQLAHLRQRSRLARSCTKVVGGCFIATRSTSLGVLQRAHLIASQGWPHLGRMRRPRPRHCCGE